MIVRLFSVFDPCVGNYHIIWIVIFIVFILSLLGYNYVGGGVEILWLEFIIIFKKTLKDVVYPFWKGLRGFGVGLFLFIFYNNFVGLFSYIFRRTSHVIVTLGMGLVLWGSCFLIGWFKNFKIRLAHLVPEGSPIVLAPLLVGIEGVRHLIRPITLSVRLGANIIAGHLIIRLISWLREMRLMGRLFSVILQLIILVLELAVSIIQGLVFSILFLLYAVEYH